MKHAFRTALAAVALGGILVPSLVLAQPGGGRGFRGGPGGPGGPGGGLLGLLQREEVQQEIQLVDEQQSQVEALADDIRSQMRDLMRNTFDQMRDLSDEERRARFDEIRAQFDKIRTDAEGRLQKVLLPHQLERLKQIDLQGRLQQGGVAALSESELADALGLTTEQQDRLRQRAEEVQQEMQEQINQLRAEARKKLLEVLTPEQRAKLEAMLGEQFDLPDRGPGGRFGRWRGGSPPPPPPPGPGPE
jgi:Spy/CpxP family protein refolding chaperone